ncbi:MAG: type III-A CRISPR-associated RAMP protein Csm3 [Promethearchaeota archaeon]
MKIFLIEGEIECLTGLHIGAGGSSIEIGGIDDPIIRNPLTELPYIPGSSLKGKMRSLLEKNFEEEKKLKFNRGHEGIKRHECDDIKQAKDCPVCRLFGSTAAGSENNNFPARLIIRDGDLTDKNSLTKDGLIVTEAKMENTIDRITAAAVPRTIERIPAGIKFNLNLVYHINEGYQKEDLQNILLCLKLIEKDGLGGNISRGYGQVEFHIKRFEMEGEEDWFPRKSEGYSYEECGQLIKQRMEK